MNIVRIVSWQGKVYVYRCPVFYVKPNSGRLICGDGGETAFQGLKPARLRQFNQQGGSPGCHVLLTTEDHYVADMAHFLRKSGLSEVVDRGQQPHHPLHDLHRKTAERHGYPVPP